jgi:hypothetical protein
MILIGGTGHRATTEASGVRESRRRRWDMVLPRTPGPIGLDRRDSDADWVGRHDVLDRARGEPEGPLGRTLWQKKSTPDTAPGPAPAGQAKGRALIVIGTGHDSIKQGVRFKTDEYFNKAALASFARYTGSHQVTLLHVDSAAAMKRAIENGPWDVVIYFGHGVENQMALAPKEMGTPLSEADLASALKKGSVKSVYLFGCKAGATGLARRLSKDVPGTTVYGTFGSLDVEWEQKKDPGQELVNRFIFKEPLSEYKDNFQMEKGKKLKTRKHEMGDKIDINADPIDPRVEQ